MSANADRSEWLHRRAGSVGASEVASLLGLSPWKSAYALWCEKTGAVDGSSDETEQQRWGNILEPAICDEYSRQTGRKTIDHGRYAVRYSSTCDHLSATLDREVEAIDGRGPGCMDAKNVGGYKAKDWEDGAPLLYQVQLQAQMEVTGYKWGSLAALIGGNEFRWCDVERNEPFIALIRKKVSEFWALVESRTPPEVDGSDSTAEVLRRLYPKDSGEVIALPGEALDWDYVIEQANRTIAEAEARKKQAKNLLVAALGSATVGILSDGGKWSYKTVDRKGHVVAPSSSRVLRRLGK